MPRANSTVVNYTVNIYIIEDEKSDTFGEVDAEFSRCVAAAVVPRQKRPSFQRSLPLRRVSRGDRLLFRRPDVT